MDDFDFEKAEAEHHARLNRRYNEERRVLHRRHQERRFSMQGHEPERRHKDHSDNPISEFERRGGARRIEQRRKPIIRR